MSSKQQKKQQKIQAKLCPSFDDNEIEKVCVNKDCQGLRVFCVSCWHKGGHSKHGSDVKGISEIDLIRKKVSQECDTINDQLKNGINLAQQQINKVNDVLTQKYQITDNQLNSLAPEELNEAINNLIKFDENKLTQTILGPLKDLNNQLSDILEELALWMSSQYFFLKPRCTPIQSQIENFSKKCQNRKNFI